MKAWRLLLLTAALVLPVALSAPKPVEACPSEGCPYVPVLLAQLLLLLRRLLQSVLLRLGRPQLHQPLLAVGAGAVVPTNLLSRTDVVPG